MTQHRFIIAVTVSDTPGEREGDVEHAARVELLGVDEGEASALIERSGVLRSHERSKTITEAERREIAIEQGGESAIRAWTLRVQERLLQEALKDVVSGTASRIHQKTGS